VGSPGGENRSLQLQKAWPFIVLSRIKDHGSIHAAGAIALKRWRNRRRTAEKFFATGDIERVQTVKVISTRIFGDCDNVDGASRPIDDWRRSNADLWRYLAATAIIAWSLARQLRGNLP